MLEEWDFQNIKIQSFILRIDPVAYWGPKVYGYSPPLDKKGMNVPIWAKKWLIFMNVSTDVLAQYSMLLSLFYGF